MSPEDAGIGSHSSQLLSGCLDSEFGILGASRTQLESVKEKETEASVP